MKSTQTLIEEVKSLGMSLEPHPGGLFVVHNKGDLHPKLAAELKAHKSELLEWLSAEHAAKQILLGEFDGCDIATSGNLVAILKASSHPVAEQALRHLVSRA